ncbi:MAG: hypothetical protein AAF206_17305 [Bacteroidota bacterium]
MKLRILFCLSCLLLGSGLLLGQENRPNAILLELGGHGHWYSVGYERALHRDHRFATRAQIGFSAYDASKGYIRHWIPFSLNESIRIANTNLHGEVGLGGIILNDPIEDNRPNLVAQNFSLRLGMRHQSETGKWIYRLAYTPFLLRDHDFFHWAGGSVGFRF